MSIALWVKFASFNANTDNGLVVKMNGPVEPGGRSYKLVYSSLSGSPTTDGTFDFFVSSDGEAGTTQGPMCPFIASIETWYFVAVTFKASAGEFRCYVNGSQLGPAVTFPITSIYDSAAPLRLGADGCSCHNLNGILDEVGIWNRVLSGTEISDLYNLGASGPSLEFLGLARLWIGLKNGDDQGTRFDLRTEVYKNNTLVDSGLTRCISGVVRNPNNASEALVAFDPMSPVVYSSGDVLSFRVLTRIGTNPADTKCPGHNNAVGLRFYYDSLQRPSRFVAQFSSDPAKDLYLHTTSVIDFLNDTAPTGSTASFKDSPSLNFSGGNPWKEIGTWSMTIPQQP